MNGKLKIASRVASYMYSDGLPYDGPEIHKNLAELYEKHSQGRHKINLDDIMKTSK